MAAAREKQTNVTELSGSPSDAQLVRRIKDDDEHAFKQLYYRYYEKLFKFIRRRVEDDDVAKELAQILFVRTWQGRERLAADQAIKSYLYKIATNLIIDFFRKKGREQFTALDEVETDLSAEPDQRFELEEMIDRAVNSLPEPLQTVFKLSRFKDMKNSEIAAELGVSVKTVESRMTRAFTILRQKLKPLLTMVIFFKLFLE